MWYFGGKSYSFDYFFMFVNVVLVCEKFKVDGNWYYKELEEFFLGDGDDLKLLLEECFDNFFFWGCSCVFENEGCNVLVRCDFDCVLLMVLLVIVYWIKLKICDVEGLVWGIWKLRVFVMFDGLIIGLL